MENTSINQEQPQDISIFWKTLVLFTVPFVLYPVGAQAIANDWSDWKMVLASAAIGIGLAVIPGVVFAFSLGAFASHDRRRGFIVLSCEALVLLVINILYSIWNSGGDIGMIGVFLSFLLVVHMTLTALVIRATNRISQKTFVGLGVFLIACVLLLAIAGLLFG